MWHFYYRQQLRRTSAQQRAPPTLEINGFVAVTLYTATAALAITRERGTGP